MLESLKKIFGNTSTEEAPDPVKRNEERLQTATCVVLVEIALADEEFTDDERSSIVASLVYRFTLSDDDAHELLDYAVEQHEASNDLWGFTHLINESCSNDEKIGIIDEVWRVIFSDGSICGHENHVAHKLATLFNLTHEQLIESKVRILAEVRSGNA